MTTKLATWWPSDFGPRRQLINSERGAKSEKETEENSRHVFIKWFEKDPEITEVALVSIR
jgi:hypothetical protein